MLLGDGMIVTSSNINDVTQGEIEMNMEKFGINPNSSLDVNKLWNGGHLSSFVM